MPRRLRPMLATAGALPADDGMWGYEVKWDGVRAIACCSGEDVLLESRNLNDITARYPELQGIAAQLAGRTAILDGEVVALDERGAPSFQRLQARMHVESAAAVRRLMKQSPVVYVVFDLLYLDGQSTTGLAYSRRRELLDCLGLQGAAWQTPPYHVGDGASFLEVTAGYGLEGLIAKWLDSPYRAGARSGEWVKVKNTGRQEFVVGGWLPGKGRRAGVLGALLLGYYEQRGGERLLRYAGRVGTGFDEAELRRLSRELAALARRDSPFGPHGVQPPREALFVEPQLVAEVEFSGWTREGVLRQSSYKGLRTDKPAQEVVRETPAGQPPATLPYTVLHETKRHTEIELDGRTLRLSNREKVLYPDAGFTKGQMVDYYATVGPWLLPHLKGRPLTLKRYPDGVQGPFFYEKRCPAHRPRWVHTVPLWSERSKEEVPYCVVEDLPYCVVEDLPTLLWVANLADIELHTSLSLARTIATPTMLVFDLDPGAPATLRECCRVGLQIKELFDELGLRTFAKTSGAKGLQLYAPLNTAVSYEQTKPFARAVAELLERRHPRQIVSRMAKSLRPGKVLIDWSQNDEHKTTVCVYSLRATERPTISTPVTWQQVAHAARSRRPAQLSLEPPTLIERLEKDGDIFAPLLTLEQKLPRLPSA